MIDNLAALGLVMALFFGVVVIVTVALIRSGRVIPAPWDEIHRHRPKRQVGAQVPREPR